VLAAVWGVRADIRTPDVGTLDIVIRGVVEET
jgi:hypothetical protein